MKHYESNPDSIYTSPIDLAPNGRVIHTERHADSKVAKLSFWSQKMHNVLKRMQKLLADLEKKIIHQNVHFKFMGKCLVLLRFCSNSDLHSPPLFPIKGDVCINIYAYKYTYMHA